MAKKMTGLGKGLEALFADNAADETESGVVTLKISQIEPNKDQPRKAFAQEALSELADSIREHGLLQPILVKPMPNGQYRIVAGERRWRASRMAGLSEVPVLIREMSSQQVMEIALIENLQREDLNAVEEAAGYRRLMDEFSLTQEEVAKRVGKSRPAIANTLRLLSLPAPVLEMIEKGSLSAGHAKVLLSIETPEQLIELAQLIVKKGLSVREAERMVRQLAKSGQEKQPGEAVFGSEKTYYIEAELSLQQQLGRKVKVAGGKQGQGKIEIEFYDKEDLQRIVKLLAEKQD